MQQIRVGVFFGGQSPEHEVSVISGLQAAAALVEESYPVTPVYVSKGGRFYAGQHLMDIGNYEDLNEVVGNAQEISVSPGPGRSLKLTSLDSGIFSRSQEWTVDVAFLVFHGGSGENGALQGLCESMGVPFTGSGVLASSVGMDKIRSKILCREAGIDVVDWVSVSQTSWSGNEEREMDNIEAKIGFPAIVKPVHLGSSIGISKVENREQLDAAVEEAFRYDAIVLVESCIANLREINCSVLGDADFNQVSVLEEPVGSGGLLSFSDKYMREDADSKTGSGGAKRTSGSEGMASLDRIIPAPVSDQVAEQISSMARTIFSTLDGCGVCRIDFLMNDETGEIFFNEINTIPGSLSFYLWEPTGLAFSDLVSRLIELAVDRFENRIRRVRTYDVNLLAQRSTKGLKGSKS